MRAGALKVRRTTSSRSDAQPGHRARERRAAGHVRRVAQLGPAVGPANLFAAPLGHRARERRAAGCSPRRAVRPPRAGASGRRTCSPRRAARARGRPGEQVRRPARPSRAGASGRRMFAASRSSATARGPGEQVRRPARPSRAGASGRRTGSPPRAARPPRAGASGRRTCSPRRAARPPRAGVGPPDISPARSSTIDRGGPPDIFAGPQLGHRSSGAGHVRRRAARQPGGRRGPARSTPAAPPRGRAKLSRALLGRRRSPRTTNMSDASRPANRADGGGRRARHPQLRHEDGRSCRARAAQVGGDHRRHGRSCRARGKVGGDRRRRRNMSDASRPADRAEGGGPRARHRASRR